MRIVCSRHVGHASSSQFSLKGSGARRTVAEVPCQEQEPTWQMSLSGLSFMAEVVVFACHFDDAVAVADESGCDAGVECGELSVASVA